MIDIFQGGWDTPSLEDVGIRRINQDCAADGWHPDDDLTLRMTDLIERILPELGCSGTKGVRDAVPVQQVTYRVRTTAVLRCDDNNFARVRGFAA
jgi:hypothetical protein